MSCFDRQTMFGKSLIQFSFDGWGCVPSLFDLRPNYGGYNEDNGELLQTISCPHCYTQHPQPSSRLPLAYAFTGDSWTLNRQVWVSLLWGHCSFFLDPGVCALRESVSPVLYKFWQFYGGVNCNVLQDGLYHSQVYCTHSPFACSSPLLTHTYSGDTQTQFCLSLSGVSGSWCAQGMFEPSEHLCWV